jgi:hypothetical protein
VSDFFIEDDSFLTKEEQDEFLRRIFSDQSFLYGKINWIPEYVPEIIDFQKTKDKSWQWKNAPTVYMQDQKSEPYFQIVSRLDFDIVKDVFEKFCFKHNIKYDKIIRSKINIATRSYKEKDSRNYPHVDSIEDHMVFLYYFNDSDGVTEVYDKKIFDVLKTVGNFGELKVSNSISPTAGKGVVFDGKKLHTGFSPKENDLRILLNICFTLNKNGE